MKFLILFNLVVMISLLGSGCTSILSEKQKETSQEIPLADLSQTVIKNVEITNSICDGELILKIKVDGEIITPYSIKKTTWTERTFKEYDAGDDFAEIFLIPILPIFAAIIPFMDDTDQNNNKLLYTLLPGYLGTFGREKNEKINIKTTYNKSQNINHHTSTLNKFDVQVLTAKNELLTVKNDCDGQLVIKAWTDKYEKKGINQLYIVINEKQYKHSL